MHDKDKDGNDISQVGINMEVLPQDPVLMQWASTHFSSEQKIANIHNDRKGRMNRGQMARPNLGSAHSTQELNIGHTASSNQSSACSPPEANSGQTASSNQSLARSSQEMFGGKMASQIQGLAHIPTNVSDGQMASLSQGSAHSLDTANPVLDSVWSPQNMSPAGPAGMANPIQALNQGNPAWYQPPAGYIWPEGQQNQSLPPFPPHYNLWYPYHMMMQQGAGGSQPGTNQMVNTVSTTVNQNSNTETKEMFVSAFAQCLQTK